MLKENNSKDIINKLSESPIYAMSLGNHELFHSNFWAWIMENDSNFVKELFGDEISGYEIKREFYNTDIAIIVGENVYVIENKFKSLPDKKQLKNYKNKFDNKRIKYNDKTLKFKMGLLISPFKTGLDLPDGWEHIKYEDVLKKISNFAENLEDDFHKRVIREYVESTREVINIMTKELSDSKVNQKLRLSSECYKETYEKIKLSDILRKLNAQQFVQHFKDKVKEDKDLLDISEYIYIDADYTHKNAIVNAFIIIPNDNNFENDNLCDINKKAEYKLLIGNQIQGNRYCRAVSRSKKLENSKPSELFDEFKGNWFDNDFENGEIDFPKMNSKKKTSMSPRSKSNDTDNGNKYNIFDKSNKNSFIYQYFNIDEEPDYKDITGLLLYDLKVANNIIGNPKEYDIKE